MHRRQTLTLLPLSLTPCIILIVSHSLIVSLPSSRTSKPSQSGSPSSRQSLSASFTLPSPEYHVPLTSLHTYLFVLSPSAQTTSKLSLSSPFSLNLSPLLSPPPPKPKLSSPVPPKPSPASWLLEQLLSSDQEEMEFASVRASERTEKLER